MEKILVCIKRVIDFNIKIRVKSDRSGVETSHVRMSINPFDEIALEQAIRLKEQGGAKELVATSIGPEGCKEGLRSALAMGMDRAIHLKTDCCYEPINIAKILEHLVAVERPDLIIMGKQAIDDDCNQTAQILAARLDWPQATFASQVQLEDQTIRVTREVDGGLETLALLLPAVITTDLRLNKPRFISLPNIMRAKKMNIDQLAVDTLQLDLKPHLTVKEVNPPSKKNPGLIVNSVAELVTKLHIEARVI